MDSKKLGKYGEDIACFYLKKKGCKILDRNYSKKWAGGPEMGEIDIVARREGIVSFIEVKTSVFNPADKFSPEDRVDFRKQKQIIKLAQIWMEEKEIPLDSKWQVDIISVMADFSSQKAKIRHFKNINI